MSFDPQNLLAVARTSLKNVPAIPPKLIRLLDKLGLQTLKDLWFHLPLRLEAWQPATQVPTAPLNTPVMLRVQVVHHMPPEARTSGRKRLYRVTCHDLSGPVILGFFHGQAAFIQKLLPPGAWCYCLGTLTTFNGQRQMIHPDYVTRDTDRAMSALFEGHTPLKRFVYPTTSGLIQAVLRRTIAQALSLMPASQEWLAQSRIAEHGWPSFQGALETLHSPEAYETPQYRAAAERLAYDELLAHQLLLGMTRGFGGALAGIQLPETPLCAALLRALPFELTTGQQQALQTIRRDLEAPKAMVRLLQGDVGSGKTVVALAALVQAIGAGYQGAFLAPTEILATQHLASFKKFLGDLPIRMALLTGSQTPLQKQALKTALAAGEIDLLLGTHALFEEDVVFPNLACVVIDEQHRFGVDQRLRLTQKAPGVNTLLMSATPIPRTLTLALYGDIDVTPITEKPQGRPPITTRVLSLERLDEVISSLRRPLEAGARVFWVCPLVSDSETLDLANVTARFQMLQEHFGEKVGLAHGQMRGAERTAAMEAFRQGALQILVATSIIEVGVDVPEASVMVIEEAQRFGLAQLHQLRGRIGRGTTPSTCLLIYRSPLGDVAHARLETLRTSNDGFKIAEQDLKLRGSGEIFGTLQSGMPSFRFATLEAHGTLLDEAAREARAILAQDPTLTTPQGRLLQTLLGLFHSAQALAYLKSG